MGFYIGMIVALVLLDIYVFQSVKTAFLGESTASWATYIYWFFCGMTYVTIAIFAVLGRDGFVGYPRLILTGVVQSFLFLKIAALPFLLISDIIRVFEWASLHFKSTETVEGINAISRSKFLNRIGLAVGGMFFGAFIYGMVRGAYNVQVKKVLVRIKNLPEGLRGLKIAQISDIHLGSFASTTPVQKAVELINAEKPDLFFFTGDFVNNTAKEAFPFKDILKNVEAKLGKYAILGNHDYGDYIEWATQKEKEENLQTLIQMQRDLDWDMLLDENRILDINGAKLAVIGVEYWGRSMGFGQKGNLEKAIVGTESADVRLLLSHDPSHWNYVVTKENRFSNIDLTFSGHTHGFQFGIEIPGLKWSPSQWVYKQWAGLYFHNKQYLYVNRGLGFLGYPGRVGIPPEITIVTLEKG